MSDIITTLHPENDSDTNLYPNILADNIPDGSIEQEKLAYSSFEEAISDWLNNHPEATTTVEDNSLSYEKLVVGTLGFVIPEMYGAVGDGVTDDLEAINSALDSGYVVYIPKKTYYLSDDLSLTTSIIGKGVLLFADSKGIIVNSSNIEIGGITITASSEYTGTGILISASPKLYIHDILLNKFNIGINNTVVCWGNNFQNIRCEYCNVGLQISIINSVQNISNSFTNIYVNHASTSTIKLYGVVGVFNGCNFGIISSTYAIFISDQCTVSFIGCNFECDELVDNFPIRIAGGRTLFDGCKFYYRINISGYQLALFDIQSLQFKNCIVQYGSDNLSTNVVDVNTAFSIQSSVPYGRIISDGTYPLNATSIYRTKRPFIKENDIIHISLSSNDLDSAHLRKGMIFYNDADNIYYYYNGTNLVSFIDGTTI